MPKTRVTIRSRLCLPLACLFLAAGLLAASLVHAQALQERTLPGASAEPAKPAPVAPPPAPTQVGGPPAEPTPPPPGGDLAPPPPAVGTAPEQAPPPPAKKAGNTYSREEINREVMGFFESGSRGLAELVSRAFEDYGRPRGYIKGNEAGGALVVGLRYGTGTLFLKGHKPVTVYWQSPSVGFDLGVNASKVFTLVYGMERPTEIFQRYPGVDGSAYVIGGFGMTYQNSQGVVLAPIRFGVGLRLGASVGYQHYTRAQDINPF